jgi:tRNA(Arg) A34 adenosine deaminase TadA
VQPNPNSLPRLGRRAFLVGAGLGAAGGALAGTLATSLLGQWPKHDALSSSPLPRRDAVGFDLDHDHFMRLAIEQAKNEPRYPFGAVIVDSTTREVVAEGYNQGRQSPTFHGEIVTINRCAARHRDIDWEQLALYTTAEPCPMCQAAIEWAGISLVVYGTSIPFLKSLGWWQIDIRAEEVVRQTPFRRTAVLGGVLEDECNALFRAIVKVP